MIIVLLLARQAAMAQQDSLDNEQLARMINLSEVVVRADLNVGRFLQHVKDDTSFYKAFRSLHLVSFSSLNDIRIRNRNNKLRASMHSKTHQFRRGNCRYMEVEEEHTTGNYYDSRHHDNYYTGVLYSNLFFTPDTICGETNIVKGIRFNRPGAGKTERRKEQLKMLLFNPGRKVPGIPFMGDKLDIFDPERAYLYNYAIDRVEYEGQSCYLFSIRAKDGLSVEEKNKLVIDSMVTWFNAKTFEVMARNYDLSYSAGVYNFDVHMEVQLTRYGQYLLPKLLRYRGSWGMLFKKQERGDFTATLFDFH